MEFAILGPLEVRDAGESIGLGGPKQRALLAMLLIRANEVVSVDALVESLWGGSPPGNAAHAIEVYVSRLRKTLEDGSSRRVLRTRAPGYVLDVAPDELDRDRFERLLGEAGRASSDESALSASVLLKEALGLWRGPALADFTYEPFAQAEIARLEELRLVAFEERIEVDLALGHHEQVIGELEALCAQQPFRERFAAQLMLALYRADRQAEALERYRATRRTMVEELGLEPGPSLQRLQQAILRQAEELEPAPEAPAQPTRKTVTALVVDLAGASSADPEARAHVMRTDLERSAELLERHGATVEHSPAARVTGIFGLPRLHEDDALRALHAAAELLRVLGNRVRIGIETGEVVAAGERVLAGDIGAAAGRLAEQARPGDTLLGEATRELGGDSVRLEPVGRRGPPWRLREIVPREQVRPHRLSAPLIGREPELSALRAAFEEVMETRQARLLAIVGEAGAGKTRLATELTATLSGEAAVLLGRCLSYGQGITFWPMREMVVALGGSRGPAGIAELLGSGPGAERVAKRAAAAVGLVGESVAAEATFSAFRTLFEALAETRPLVLVFEDLHWAEPTLLDLVDYLASAQGPLLLLCLARPELLDSRAALFKGRSSIALEPLSDSAAGALVDALAAGSRSIDSETRARIRATADGNPLFIEQLLAVVLGGRTGDPGSLPPTINALLAARLDALGPGERAVVERAAVVGKEFEPGAVAELMPPEARSSVPHHLESLTRKQLVRAAGTTFQHVLIRDAAYRAIPKDRRAELHERYAAALEQGGGGPLRELPELTGYHLEQAFLLRAELGTEEQALAARAAERLGAAGRRALARGDMPAAAGLLERATSLLREEDAARLVLLPLLGEVLRDTGALSRADAVFAQAIEQAEIAGDRRTEARSVIGRLWLGILRQQMPREELLSAIERTVPVLENLGDDAALASAWSLLAQLNHRSCTYAVMDAMLERALTHARRAGDAHAEAEILYWLPLPPHWGPMPAAEAIHRCEQIREAAERAPLARARAEVAIAGLLGMRGRFAEARELLAGARAVVNDLGRKVLIASFGIFAGQLEMLAGAAAEAEREFRRSVELLVSIGEESHRGTNSGYRGEALCMLGGYDEAEQAAATCRRLATEDDAVSQVMWRRVESKVLGSRGDADRAVMLAREAVARAANTDNLELHGGALRDLATSLHAVNQLPKAARAAENALELFERKGNLVATESVQALVAEFRSA